MAIAVPQEPDDGREVVRSIDADGNLVFGRVGINEIDYKGRFGASTFSLTSNDISIGIKTFTLYDNEDKFRVGDDIIISSLDDPRCFMWGEILDKDTTAAPALATVFVDDISDIVAYGMALWEIQVVARPKPGIEKDTSTTSVDPTTGGPWTFTVTAGKFFPIGGTLLIKPTADRTIALIGEVKAYSGTSLAVSLRSTNATVSTSYTSWSIALLDAPPASMMMLEKVGLAINLHAIDLSHDLHVAEGFVRDTTDTVTIELADTLRKQGDFDFVAGTPQGCQVKSDFLSGTVSSSGTAVTGTGTAFTTDFSVGNAITSGSTTVTVTAIADDNNLTTSADLGASGAQYKRGGYSSTGTAYYVGSLVRRDSDGLGDFILSQDPDAGTNADLPSGWTYYRPLVSVTFTAGVITAIEVYLENIYDMDLVVLSNSTLLTNERAITSSDSVIIDTTTNANQVRLSRAALTGDVTASQNSNATTIANDAVSNAKLANMGAYSLKMNNTGSSTDPTDTAITALTEKTSIHNDDLLLLVDSEASNVMKKAKKSNVGGIGMGKAIAAAIVFG